MTSKNLTQHNLYAQAVKTMTSREIAAVVEKRHDNVKRTIEMLASKGAISSPQSEDFKNINNVSGTEYLVGKRDSYVIVAQLSPEFTARLVDRWQELEAQQATAQPAPAFTLPDFSNPAIAARAWADQFEEKLALAAQVEEMKPSVAALERLSDSEGAMTITSAAKSLKLNRNKLIAWMEDNKWVYRAGGIGDLIAYQNRIDAGLMIHRATGYTGHSGEHIKSQARVTAKGLATISKQIEKARQITAIVGVSA